MHDFDFEIPEIKIRDRFPRPSYLSGTGFSLNKSGVFLSSSLPTTVLPMFLTEHPQRVIALWKIYVLCIVAWQNAFYSDVTVTVDLALKKLSVFSFISHHMASLFSFRIPLLQIIS